MNLLNWQLQERVSLKFQNKASNGKESLFVTQHLYFKIYFKINKFCLFWNISHYLGCLGVFLSYYWTKKKQVTLCATSFLSDVVQFLHLQYKDSYDLFQSSSHFGAMADHFNWYIKLLFLSVHLKCWVVFEQWYVTVHGKTYLNAYPLDKQKR